MNNYIRKALRSDYTPPKITIDEAEIMADLRYPAPAVAAQKPRPTNVR